MIGDVITKGGILMGKKHRNRIRGQKKNNHVPIEDVIAKDIAHEKEMSAEKRKR